jgi:transglutaminase-like putative cysteine protease/predicted glutamine amidotransferase
LPTHSKLTSEILAISLDSFGSPSINTNLSKDPENKILYNWGFGWYPQDNQSTIVKKEDAIRGTQILINDITDWSNFRSTVFFLKIKDLANKYPSNEDVQPFSRSFSGRDWMFVHSGFLDKQALTMLYGTNKILEPLGTTDSELAFCNILSQIEEVKANKISDIEFSIIYEWFKRFDLIGSSDMYLTDGDTIICYHGLQSKKNMHYIRILPPENQNIYNSEIAQISFNNPRDIHRTAIIVSSSPFSEGKWTKMQPGQMIIIKCGAIIWNSLYYSKTIRSIPSSPPNAQQKKDNIYTQKVQAEQAQERILNARSITETVEGIPLGYRLYEITHTTLYEYTIPVEHSTHSFHLQPTEDNIQEVIYSKLKISSSSEEIQYEDVFGNKVINCIIDKPYKKLLVEAVSCVKVYGTQPDDHTLSKRQTSIPLVWMPWQRQMMMPYLLPSELPESQFSELTEYAMSFVKRNNYNLLKTIEDINMSIYRDYKYVTGSTSLDTTSFEVYISRQGVCQDFANLLICLARLLSIPARYRMGYVYTGDNHANKMQSNASHAWAELYLPYVGWRGFDPTNGCLVEQDHVRVACGRNYIDSAPVSGTIYRGGGVEKLTVNVEMKQIRE